MNDEIDELPQELQDALMVLIRHAGHSPSASIELRDAVRTASRYLPRPFAAEDYPGLVTAIDTIGAIAAGRYPGMDTELGGWPNECTARLAEYVHSVLTHNTVLPLVILHAPLLAEITLFPELVDSAHRLQHRLLRRADVPKLSPTALPEWARLVHGQVVELHGYLLGVPRRNHKRTK